MKWLERLIILLGIVFLLLVTGWYAYRFFYLFQQVFHIGEVTADLVVPAVFWVVWGFGVSIFGLVAFFFPPAQRLIAYSVDSPVSKKLTAYTIRFSLSVIILLTMLSIVILLLSLVI